jgi:hypothetical protein
VSPESFDGLADRVLGLPPGTVSYADRDWLTAGGDSLPALSFAPDGEILWRGRGLGPLAAGSDSTTVAAGALLRVARDAAAAASEHRGGPVEVVGAGLVAREVRRFAGDRRRSGDTPPAVVVDTTGDPDRIRSALERVSDLGMVVLAGESSGQTLDLDLYSSVHRRGLVVVGVASPLQNFNVASWSDFDEEELDACRDALGDVSSGTRPLADSLWYRLEA